MRSSHAVASPPSLVRKEIAKEEREDSGSELPNLPSSTRREAPKDDKEKGGDTKEEKEDSDSEVEEMIFVP